MVTVNFSDVFELMYNSKTRGHAHKLYKFHSNNTSRHRFLSKRWLVHPRSKIQKLGICMELYISKIHYTQYILNTVLLMLTSASFYRATRMHSADYAVARCLSVCLSVRHTPVLCVNGYTYPQIFFSLLDSPTILVFQY